MDNFPYKALVNFDLPCTVKREQVIDGWRMQYKHHYPMQFYKNLSVGNITSTDDGKIPTAVNLDLVTLPDATRELISEYMERCDLFYRIYQQIDFIPHGAPASVYAGVGHNIKRMFSQYLMDKMEQEA